MVAQPVAEMGRLAAETLVGRLSGDTSPGRTTVLPTTLVLRGSELRPGPTRAATGA